MQILLDRLTGAQLQSTAIIDLTSPPAVIDLAEQGRQTGMVAVTLKFRDAAKYDHVQHRALLHPATQLRI